MTLLDEVAEICTAHIRFLQAWEVKRMAAEQRVLERYLRGEMVRYEPTDYTGCKTSRAPHREGWVTRIFAEGKTTDGCCRWCGLPVVKPARCWHKDCADERAVGDWSYTRHYINMILEVKRSKCACCGEIAMLEIDHKRRLVDWNSVEAHFLSNLQGLCTDCHKAKTAREAATRPVNEAQKGLFNLDLT